MVLRVVRNDEARVRFPVSPPTQNDKFIYLFCVGGAQRMNCFIRVGNRKDFLYPPSVDRKSPGFEKADSFCIGVFTIPS